MAWFHVAKSACENDTSALVVEAYQDGLKDLRIPYQAPIKGRLRALSGLIARPGKLPKVERNEVEKATRG